MTKHNAVNPLTMDELARRDDQPAAEPVPVHVASALSAARVTVTLPKGETTPKASERSLVLPEGSFLGRAVQEVKRHDLGSLAAADNPEPHRPSWHRLSSVPRPSGLDQRVMRRKNGRLLIPTDSGRAYGEYPARVPYYPSGYPWTCIGRIFVWADARQANWSSYGAAALIGQRSILTAGHVVPWGSRNSWKAQFVAAYYDGASTVGPGGQSWVTSAHGWNTGDQVAAHDMAVMRLEDPLGTWLGYLGSKAYADNWQDGRYWHLVGYPSAVTSERPSWQGGIAVLDDDEDGNAQELEHHGDDTGGDSGGPFFGFWNDGPSVIGTVSGYETVSGFLGIGSEDNNIVAGGSDLNALVAYARANWP